MNNRKVTFRLFDTLQEAEDFANSLDFVNIKVTIEVIEGKTMYLLSAIYNPERANRY